MKTALLTLILLATPSVGYTDEPELANTTPHLRGVCKDGSCNLWRSTPVKKAAKATSEVLEKSVVVARTAVTTSCKVVRKACSRRHYKPCKRRRFRLLQ